jgi:hypothetical protein
MRRRSMRHRTSDSRGKARGEQPLLASYRRACQSVDPRMNTSESLGPHPASEVGFGETSLRAFDQAVLPRREVEEGVLSHHSSLLVTLSSDKRAWVQLVIATAPL